MKYFSQLLSKNVCGILLCSIISAVPLCAQQSTIDSLKKTLAIVPDSQKVHNTIRISFLLNRENTDSSLVYAQRALALAEQLNDIRLISLAKLQLAIHASNTSQYDVSTSNALSAFSVFDSINDYENASYAANVLGHASSRLAAVGQGGELLSRMTSDVLAG